MYACLCMRETETDRQMEKGTHKKQAVSEYRTRQKMKMEGD